MRHLSLHPQFTTTTTVPTATANVRMEGYYHVELRNKATGECKFSGSFPNVITNTFMNGIGASGSVFSTSFVYLALGSGSTTPSGSDTKLAGEFGSRSNNNASFVDDLRFVTGSSNRPDSAYRAYIRYRFFGEGVNTGSISELGWFESPTTGLVMSRALIRDPSTGLPTTIVKDAGDELIVAYEFRVVFPTDPVTVNTTIGPTSHSITAMPIGISSIGFAPFGGSPGWGRLYESRLVGPVGSVGKCIFLNNPISIGSNPTALKPSSNPGFTLSGTDGPSWSISGTLYGEVDSGSYEPYVANTFYNDMVGYISSTNTSVNAFVSNSISGMIFETRPNFYFDAGMYLIKFDPPIIKTNTQRFKFVIRISWARSGSV